PHAPQFRVSVLMLTSQPLAGPPSQSKKPALQLVLHAPFMQAEDWLAAAVHVLPQAPQFLSSVVALTSQPLLAPRSQSRKPRLQLPTPHMPPVQPGVALGGARQVAPQLPQFWM